jgi:hypothetical protein
VVVVFMLVLVLLLVLLLLVLQPLTLLLLLLFLGRELEGRDVTRGPLPPLWHMLLLLQGRMSPQLHLLLQCGLVTWQVKQQVVVQHILGGALHCWRPNNS